MRESSGGGRGFERGKREPDLVSDGWLNAWRRLKMRKNVLEEGARRELSVRGGGW